MRSNILVFRPSEQQDMRLEQEIDASAQFLMARAALPWNICYDAFASSLVDELAKYPPEIIRKLRDPAAGVLANIEFLTIHTVARECERLMRSVRVREESEQQQNESA